MAKTRLAIISSNRPHPEHSVRAANVVIYEMIRALARRDEFEVGLLIVTHESDPEPSDEEKAGLKALNDAGVTTLGEVRLPEPQRIGNRIDRLLAPRIEHFYPDYVHGEMIGNALATWQPDIALIPWSEWLTGACADLPMAKFAYYGNPDHKTGLVRIRHDMKLDGPSLARLSARLGLWRLEQVHLEVMRRYDLVGDVAANDAAYYRDQGMTDAFYVRNIWIDRMGEAWRARRDELEDQTKVRIIANIGKLGATANRYGMEYLGTQVLPELRRLMKPGSYVVEIIGAGDLHPKIRKLLESEDVAFRGFVDDIDAAMLSAHFFVCMNNASPFNVCHTRYLHAWTLGSCVVAHRDTALALPEIEHDKNALLGSSGREIAELIAQAANDRALRRRIGEGGWETYKAFFTAEHVASDIANRITDHFHASRETKQ